MNINILKSKRIFVGMIAIVLCMSLCACKRTTNDYEKSNVLKNQHDIKTEAENTDIPVEKTLENNDANIEVEKTEESYAVDIKAEKKDESKSKDAQKEDVPKIKSEENAENVHTSQPIKPSLSKLGRHDTDLFTAKIISKTKIDDVDFESYGNRYAQPMLYTVEVLDTFWALSASKGAVIDVIHYVQPGNEDGYFAKDYEIGETYLIYGLVQPYREKAVIVDVEQVTSRIDREGNLVPISTSAEICLKDIPTIDDFLKNEAIINLRKTEPDIPYCFYKIVKEEKITYSSDSAVGTINMTLDDTQSENLKNILQELVKTENKIVIQ